MIIYLSEKILKNINYHFLLNDKKENKNIILLKIYII